MQAGSGAQLQIHCGALKLYLRLTVTGPALAARRVIAKSRLVPVVQRPRTTPHSWRKHAVRIPSGTPIILMLGRVLVARRVRKAASAGVFG